MNYKKKKNQLHEVQLIHIRINNKNTYFLVLKMKVKYQISNKNKDYYRDGIITLFVHNKYANKNEHKY